MSGPLITIPGVTDAELRAVINGVGAIAKALSQTERDEYVTAAQNLVAALAPILPSKPDGSAFTDDELHAAALAAEQPFLDALAIVGPADPPKTE